MFQNDLVGVYYVKLKNTITFTQFSYNPNKRRENDYVHLISF